MIKAETLSDIMYFEYLGEWCRESEVRELENQNKLFRHALAEIKEFALDHNERWYSMKVDEAMEKP